MAAPTFTENDVQSEMAIYPQVFFVIVHMSVVMTLAILGNLFLGFIIIRGNRVIRRRVSPVQLLLLHTCAADLLFAVFSLGTEIVIMLDYPRFSGPDWLCRLTRYGQMVPLYASPFLLVAISADRYHAICRPLVNFRRSRYRRPNCLAAVAWVLAFLCSIPQVFIWKKKTTETKHVKYDECGTIYEPGTSFFKTIYVCLFNTVAWLLPSLLAAAFYYCVCRAVWASHNTTNVIQPSAKYEEENQSFVTQDYVERLRKKSCGYRRQRSEFDRKRVQTVRLTLTIIACNFFLWAPFCIVNVLQAIAPALLRNLHTDVILFMMILGNLNSCVNPWVYIFFNGMHVRRALCWRRTQPNVSSQKSDIVDLSAASIKRRRSQRQSFTTPCTLRTSLPGVATPFSSRSAIHVNNHSTSLQRRVSFASQDMEGNGEAHATLLANGHHSHSEQVSPTCNGKSLFHNL